jgi:hypothetical protein
MGILAPETSDTRVQQLGLVCIEARLFSSCTEVDASMLRFSGFTASHRSQDGANMGRTCDRANGWQSVDVSSSWTACAAQLS